MLAEIGFVLSCIFLSKDLACLLLDFKILKIVATKGSYNCADIFNGKHVINPIATIETPNMSSNSAPIPKLKATNKIGKNIEKNPLPIENITLNVDVTLLFSINFFIGP